MMALLNNWDIKDTNNKILLVRDGSAGRGELHYIVSDPGAVMLRATAGKIGAYITEAVATGRAA